MNVTFVLRLRTCYSHNNEKEQLTVDTLAVLDVFEKLVLFGTYACGEDLGFGTQTLCSLLWLC